MDRRYADNLELICKILEQLLGQIKLLEKKVDKMDATTQASVDKLNAAVAQETTIEQSVETLLIGLSAMILQLKQGQTDPAVIAAIDAAAAIVTSNNDKATAAITANTPVATA